MSRFQDEERRSAILASVLGMNVTRACGTCLLSRESSTNTFTYLRYPLGLLTFCSFRTRRVALRYSSSEAAQSASFNWPFRWACAMAIFTGLNTIPSNLVFLPSLILRLKMPRPRPII